MAFDQYNRAKNEIEKFAEGSDGQALLKAKLIDGVTITEGSSFDIKDHDDVIIFTIDSNGITMKDADGFPMFWVDRASGDIHTKGNLVKEQ